MSNIITYAADWESYYDRDCSVAVLGPRSYFAHPSFDAYLLTVVGDNGYSFVGHPQDFDFELFRNNRVVMHNAAFDESLYRFGVEKGWYPEVPFETYCTADLAAYCGLPRSLKGTSAALFGVEVDKTVRDNMQGKRWGSMTPDFQEQVKAYALKDAELCLKIWQELEQKWPDPERAVSLLNRRICQRGIPLDEDMLRQNLEGIRVRLFEAESAIPWASETTPLSRKSLNQACRQMGIDPPASLAKDSPEADAWLAKHRNDCPWVSAVSDYRRINSFIKKLEAFNLGTQPDGRYYGGYMYFGANPTGRFSGSGGNLNLQNLPRGEMFGVQFREMIRPRPGKVLVVADLSQIEVRTLSYLAGDFRALDEIRKADDIYHAFGVLLGLHDPANGPLKAYSSALRSQVKMITLGCGFGMSANGFAAKEGISLAEAETAVGLYRAKMKSVVDYWKSLDEDIRMSSALNQPLRIELPSSRVMDYGLLRRMKNSHGSFSYVGKMVRQGQVRDFRLWHGLMCENCISHSAEVLTDTKGWVPLSSVELADKVWDGEEFVSHKGFVDRGVEAAINVHGVWATPDHEFLVGEKWIPAEKACGLSEGMVSIPHEAQRLDGEEVRNMHSNQDRRQLCFGGPPVSPQNSENMGDEVRLRESDYKTFGRHTPHEDLRSRLPLPEASPIRGKSDPRKNGAQTLRSVAVDARPLPSSEPSRVGELRGQGDSRLSEMAGQLPELLGRHESDVERRAVSGPNRQHVGVFEGELPMGDSEGAEPEHSEICDPRVGLRPDGVERTEQIHGSLSGEIRMADASRCHDSSRLPQQVGDLFDCGPRHRFAVRGGEGLPVLIAHNCAQATARDIFCDLMLAIDQAGHQIIMHTHDEVVIECDAGEAEDRLKDVLAIMSRPPEWIPAIPLAAEGQVTEVYTK